MYKRILHQNVE